MNKRVKKNKKAVALLVALVVFLSLGGMAAAGQDWSNHWAGKQISCWLEKELITGYPDGSFQPDAAISRAEFFALINRLFGFEKQAAVYFADVTDGAWYQEDIAKALAAGYLSGYPDGTIRPNNPISRQEAAKVISLAFAYRESSPDGYSAFTDADQIGPWAREYVSLMTQKGIITGYPDGSFRPNQNISRAETVVMLSRAAGQIYNQAGVYSEDTNGNVFVNRGSITLQDMTIAGDLYLAEGIGEGEITLDRVTVQGNTIVKGGGIHSIIIKDCQFSKLIITKEDGKIRILATGSTTINETQLRSGAILEQEDISGEGFGYIVITESLDEDELIELVGDYDSVEIRAKGIQVQVSGGTIGNLEIAPEAANTNIKLAQGSQVTNLTANAPVTVTGKGTIQTALVNTDGTKIETPVAKLETAPGIKVDAKVEEPSPKSRGGGSTKTVPISAVIIVEDVAKVGETLTAKVTPDTATVRYQWQIAEREDGEYEDIDGATGKTYKPDGEDIDKYIRVVVKGYGSYSGTKTSAAVGPVGAPEYSIYKLSYADLADSYVVVDSLIGTDEWGKAINNTEVEQAISGLTPVKLTLETEIEGKNGYGSVRIKPVEAGENIQFWAKDEDGGGNWYNINISGWGDPSGFELPAQYTATTHIYILSNKVGTYDLTVQLVKVGNNEVIAQVEGTIRIRDKERSEYGFEIEDADQVFVAGELLDSSGIIAGEDGVDTTGLTPVKVTLKAIQIKELGYEQVRVLPPDVTQTEGSGGQLQFWAYSEDDGLWFDAAVHGWGDGFELTPDYKKTTEVYVFADAAGTYEVTFKLVEWSESGQVGEPIATRTATITVISQEMAEEINKAKAAIKPSWEVGGVEPVDGDEALPSGVENVDYKVTIKTSYV